MLWTEGADLDVSEAFLKLLECILMRENLEFGFLFGPLDVCGTWVAEGDFFIHCVVQVE